MYRGFERRCEIGCFNNVSMCFRRSLERRRPHEPLRRSLRRRRRRRRNVSDKYYATPPNPLTRPPRVPLTSKQLSQSSLLRSCLCQLRLNGALFPSAAEDAVAVTQTGPSEQRLAPVLFNLVAPMSACPILLVLSHRNGVFEISYYHL